MGEVRRACFVDRAEVYWRKEIAVEEEHEPVVIDLALDSDCSSDTDTASEKENIYHD